ncbi:DNA recombination protein RmuC [Candidatus Uhrbacteria bacterium]|nr:DNA recombination protein RmuC [Candidatus Uhrbacteria bacterium]
MNELFLAILGVGLIAALVIYFTTRRNAREPEVDGSLLTLLNDLRREIQESTASQRKEVEEKLDTMHERLVSNLKESSSTLQNHFQHTTGIIRDVTERLTKLDETNKQVLGFSTQLQSLENILKNPKQRGILGEYWLESLLGQVLPAGQYQMQYQLGVDEKSGQSLIPDAVIFVKEMLIPIDAKFSLENYNRISQEIDAERRELLEREFKTDVKLRIDETSKYIQPEKGTTNFAFMFVPAEGVYHNLISDTIGTVKVNSRNLIEYAFEKGVMIVSPTSFFAYLQTVMLGLKALQIEDSVKEIQKQAEQLMRHMKAYEDHHNRLGKQLETTVRTYTSSSQELKKIDKDVFRITNGAAGKQLEPLEIEGGQTLEE